MKRIYQITLKESAGNDYLVRAESSNEAMNLLLKKIDITSSDIYAINVLDYLDDAEDLNPMRDYRLVFGIRMNRGNGKEQYALAPSIWRVSVEYPNADAIWQNNEQEILE